METVQLIINAKCPKRVRFDCFHGRNALFWTLFLTHYEGEKGPTKPENDHIA